MTPAAASTVGTFLRAFTAGHARQLDAVQEDLLRRAWAVAAGPKEPLLKLDLDSTVVETYGLKKQGGKDFTYLHTRGYHPLLAVIAESGEVIHSRLREGRASSGRGAGSFARQALARTRRRWKGEVVLRADSGFYAEKVVAACQAHKARFSISVRLQKSHQQLIAAIPEEAWQPIPYWLEGAADVAEIPYRPFGKQQSYRLIVRRVAPTPGTQLWLKGLAYSYYAFITDREGDTLELEADHRQHAVVENVIRDLKYGLALNHMHSGQRGLAGPERDRPQPGSLDGPLGRLRDHLPEDLATAPSGIARTAGPAWSAARAAPARRLALAEAVHALLAKLEAVALPLTT